MIENNVNQTKAPTLSTMFWSPATTLQAIVSKICHLLHAYYITMSPIFTFYFQSGRVGTATKPLPYARLTTTAATTFKKKEEKRYHLKKIKRAKSIR